MLFKHTDHLSKRVGVKELSQVFYIIYNPAFTLPLSAVLVYFERSLVFLFALHLLNLMLYKVVPMIHFGADSEMDISNHVASALFLVAGAWYSGFLHWELMLPVFLFIMVTSVFSVVERGQHTLGGALLGAASAVLIFLASGMELAPHTVSAVSVTGLLYLAFLRVQSFKRQP